MKLLKTGSILLFILLVGLFLWGCGSSISGGGSEKTVTYTVNGSDIVNNADHDTLYTVPTQGTEYRYLTWECGNYKNIYTKKKVFLTFKKTNGIWVLDGENISNGNCD
jgi:hypothetical protein